VGLASVAVAIWEALVEWGDLTRWLWSHLSCDDLGGCRVRVGGGSALEVGMLVVERNFAKFSGEGSRDDFEKCHETSLRVGCHGEVALEGARAICGANPGAENEGVATVED
jgi:hypothetical protein